MTRAALVAAMLLANAACSKSEAPRQGSTAASSASVAAAPSGSIAAPRASASAGPAASVVWTGTYESNPGTMYVPEGKEWEGVKFRGEKSEVGLGKGDLRLTVDPRGNVTGTIEGPLGPATASGLLKDDTLTARIDPSPGAPNGFTGTLTGAVSGAGISGKIFLSQSEARVIREASFVLKRN